MVRNILAFFIICFLLFFKGNLYASNRTIDSLNRELKTATADSTRVDLHAQMSNLLLATDYKESFKHAMLAVQLAEKNSYYAPKVKAYRVAGAVCMYMGLNDLAVKYYSNYYELAELKQDKSEMGAAYFNLASVQLALNNFAKAKEVLLKSDQLLQEGYSQKGQKVPDFIVLMFRLNLGLIFQQLGELGRADSTLSLAMPMAKGVVGQEAQLLKLYQIQSRVFISKKELDSALLSILDARRLATQLGDIAGETATYISSGEIFQQKGDIRSAIGEYSEGFRMAEQIGATSLQLMMAEPLYKLYQQKGNTDSSKRYFNIFTSLKEQTKDVEAKEQLMRNELLQEYKKLEAAVQQKASTDKRFYFFTSLGALVVALIGFAGTLAYRKRYRALQLEKVRKDLEAQRMELEKLQLEAQVSHQEKQLADFEYRLSKNAILEGLVSGLQHPGTTESATHTPLSSKSEVLQANRQGKVWEEFEIRFLKTHAGFYDRLLTVHSDLTTNERRLCSFLRLDMTTKEISLVTSQTVRAVEIARTRLRKKLNMTQADVSLFDYLSNI